MDWRLEQACLGGDLPGFLNLVQEKEDILGQTTADSANNALHIASRFGWAELVGEIIRLRQDLVLGENEKKETPCHEACREGRIQALMLLMESNPWVVYKLNKNGESGLFLACGRGHVDLVKHLLSRSPFLLACEEDGMPASLHAAVSGGFVGNYHCHLRLPPLFCFWHFQSSFHLCFFARVDSNWKTNALFLSLLPFSVYRFKGILPNFDC